MNQDKCDYHERDVPCRNPFRFLVVFDGTEVRLCHEHAKPKYHPADLRRKLPVSMWLRR